MSKALEALGNNARTRMKALGLSQDDVAKAIGSSQSTLNKYLTGKTTPGVEVVERIAVALNWQAWELLKPEDAKPTPSHAEALAAAALSDPTLRAVLAIWPKLDDIGREGVRIAAEDLLRGQPPAGKKARKNSAGPQGTS